MPLRLTRAVRAGAGVCAGLGLAAALTLSGGAPASAATPAAATAPVATAVRIAAAPGWTTLPDPFGKTATATRIATFGAAGVAVTGAARSIAVSTDGGAHWKLRSLPVGGYPATDVAFSDATHGWAVAAGAIDETTDGGLTWTRSTATGAFDAIAAATDDSLVCALSPASVLTATSVAAPAFTAEATGLTAYPTTPAAIVAGQGGFAAATGANGALLVRASDGTWSAQDSTQDGLSAPVALALAPDQVWGNGTPDLFALSATTTQGSDDEGASFQALPARPAAAGARAQRCAAVLGAPDPQLLVGGQSGLLERYDLAAGAWSVDTAPLKGTIVSCAASAGGVAYALTSDGQVERTLSYGAAPFTLSATASSLTAGAPVTLTCGTTVLAPGTLTLQGRAGSGAWKTRQSWQWSAVPPALGAVTLRPLATTQYRLRFAYVGQAAVTSAAVKVSVRPRLTVSPTAVHVSVGSTYRLRGTVYPAQPGRSVTIWTNRGGSWHRVSDGGVIALVNGTTYRTRLFGTPVRETYHLQVRLAGSAWFLPVLTPGVKVTVS
jgi:hypothetical protein